MPARAPCDQVTTVTRSPRGPWEMLTLTGAPMPRTTSHSVCPSATDPDDGGAAPAGPSVSALALVGLPAGAMPGQAPSALTRSSAVTGLSGVKGGASIETFLMNSRPGRENHSASFRVIRSGVPEQPAISGANTMSAKRHAEYRFAYRTMKLASPSLPFRVAPQLVVGPSLCGVSVARWNARAHDGKIPLIPHGRYSRRRQRPRSSACQ